VEPDALANVLAGQRVQAGELALEKLPGKQGVHSLGVAEEAFRELPAAQELQLMLRSRWLSVSATYTVQLARSTATPMGELKLALLPLPSELPEA
jgi:hypothetical protein